MIDKKFCMSSYLAFRYIEKENVDFYEGLCHENFVLLSSNQRKLVFNADDIDHYVGETFSQIKGKKGLLLSGGMDSAILASYMPGCDAYTFRFCGGDYQREELERAEYYAQFYGLKLHYVDINWSTVEHYLDMCMKKKGSPVHSIEPQILQAALQAKNDGIETMVVGASSDLVFGGMDQLLSKDWSFDAFMNRYIFTNPKNVLVDAEDMSYLFERFRQGNKIDFLSFMEEVSLVECSSSYMNAFNAADMSYVDPYVVLKMAEPLDLHRIRNGESKYLIRELFAKKYPNRSCPDKLPMPRPVDLYFENWEGPKRYEFKKHLDMSQFTGNQKWQMYCLERFLNMYEPENDIS